MSNTNNKAKSPLLDPSTILSSGILDSETSSPASSGITQELQKALLYELNQNRARQEEKERIQQAARDNNIQDVKHKMENDRLIQEGCQHIKPAPSRDSAVAGQRDHRGEAHFICQYCAKEWTGTTLPPHLRIPAERVGGPIL